MTKYKILFTSGETEIVFAFGGEAARILAQAEQIKKGNSYVTLSITNIG